MTFALTSFDDLASPDLRYFEVSFSEQNGRKIKADMEAILSYSSRLSDASFNRFLVQ